ncbi:type II toxin-antitoxin system death-on-curing family toxin [Bacillus sp. IITD106]|nr:type II toxin-antitoxin system death-on-curing family toxin [Bacillus sp. IITD106]
MVKYLTEDEILYIHCDIMETHQEPESQIGVKYPDKFKAMLERPKSGFGDFEFYPCIIEKACCYYHSITRNHIFHNGNKRTGLSVFITFLLINGYEFTMPEQELEDYTVELADNPKYATNDCISIMVKELEKYMREF